MADETADTGAQPADDTSTTDNNAETGGTTPEEIASVLKGSNITVVPTVATETEEGTENDDEGIAEDVSADPEADSQPAESTGDDKKPSTTDPAKDAAVGQANATPDFSFTVENEEGQTFKINPGDNLDETLKDFTPKSAGQLMEIIKQQSAAEANLEKYNTEQEAAQTEAARTERIAAIQQTWDKEIADLQGAKRLEVTTDGKPSERLQQVYDFMGKENAKRAESGKPQLASIEDALDKLELQESRDKAAQADKDAKDTARQNGALVGGSSAPASSGPRPYVAGSARNANEAIRLAGLI